VAFLECSGTAATIPGIAPRPGAQGERVLPAVR
jgi:hypothetical protein